jgi:hypothetical protein
MNVNYNDKTQSQAYDPTLWNAQDANEVKNAINSKVDAVDGKGLSTNDYTTADKNKLASLTTGGGGSAETTTTIKQKLGTASELTDGYITANDFTAFKNKVDKVNGVVPLSQLPEAILNANQFEQLADGSIGIKTSYLISLGLTSGGGTTPTEPSNTTPAAPSLSADDTNNTLSASHALGNSEIVVSTNGSAYVAYGGTIQVGDIARSAGYYKFKIRSATGRNESAEVYSPAFTQAPVGNATPAAPTNGVVNDSTNTFGFTLTSGIALSGNYQYTLDGGTTVADVTVNPIVIGNVAKAVNQVGVRVKAASGRNASAWLFNTSAFTVSTAAPSTAVPITQWASVQNGVAVDANSFSFTTPQGEFGFAYSDKKIAVGTNGFVQFDGILPVSNDITAALGLVAAPRAVYGHDQGINAWYASSNKIVSRIGGVWNDSQWTAAGVNTKIRLRVDTTLAYVESSTNNGVDWTIVRSGARPDGDLYVRVFADVGRTDLLINNIQGSGLV